MDTNCSTRQRKSRHQQWKSQKGNNKKWTQHLVLWLKAKCVIECLVLCSAHKSIQPLCEEAMKLSFRVSLGLWELNLHRTDTYLIWGECIDSHLMCGFGGFKQIRPSSYLRVLMLREGKMNRSPTDPRVSDTRLATGSHSLLSQPAHSIPPPLFPCGPAYLDTHLFHPEDVQIRSWIAVSWVEIQE